MTFDPGEATVESVHKAIFADGVSCRAIVQAFLARIEALNPLLNAIISLNPHALREADSLDKRLSENDTSGLLFGVPILLKDNFDAIGIPTTAGSAALKAAWPMHDAEVVSALRSAGAIILGKTNLHEFALEGLTISSLGGQTLNPYDLTRTPGGSSGGSAVAVAASLAVMSTGTDTVNSLRNPASANSLYSFRPTPGLVSCAGVVPVSSTQDVAGMIGRSLSDISIALAVMSSAVTEDGETSKIALPRVHAIDNKDYMDVISGDQSGHLASYRIGILNDLLPNGNAVETEAIRQAIGRVRELFLAEGVDLFDVDDPLVFDIPNILATMDTQMYEFKDQLDSYLSSTSREGEFPRSFTQLFRANSSEFLVIPAQYSYIRTALHSSTTSPEYADRKERILRLTHALHEVFEVHDLDAVVYPQQQNLVVPVGSTNQYGRNGILAAVTGCPVVCIPIGFSQSSAQAPVGVPIGMEILGLPHTESKLLHVAKGIDDKVKARRAPITDTIGDKFEPPAWYECVPKTCPPGLDASSQRLYPPGRLQESDITDFNSSSRGTQRFGATWTQAS